MADGVYLIWQFEQERMEDSIESGREMQDLLQDWLGNAIPCEFRLTQKWELT